jgi:hypothetical protein
VNSPPSLFFSIKYEKEGVLFLEFNALAMCNFPYALLGCKKEAKLII